MKVKVNIKYIDNSSEVIIYHTDMTEKEVANDYAIQYENQKIIKLGDREIKKKTIKNLYFKFEKEADIQ
jgi:hypothetical protein